jgi:hypothetical protein
MKKLIEIQNELKVPKGNFNAFGKYKYRSAEQILEAVKPVLKRYNATLMLSDSIEPIGNKLFLKATALLYLDDKEIKTYGFAEMGEHKGMSSEQCTGTASSYARKYALNGLFLIDETEADPDSKEPTKEPKKDETQKANAGMSVQQACEVLKTATTLDMLRKLFESLPKTVASDLMVVKTKDELKTKLK